MEMVSLDRPIDDAKTLFVAPGNKRFPNGGRAGICTHAAELASKSQDDMKRIARAYGATRTVGNRNPVVLEFWTPRATSPAAPPVEVEVSLLWSSLAHLEYGQSLS
jgi:hypothetical protein